MKETFVVEARGTGVARMSVLGHHNTPHTDDHCVLGLAARALHKYRGGNESWWVRACVSERVSE